MNLAQKFKANRMADGGTPGDYYSRNRPYVKSGAGSFNTPLGTREPAFREWVQNNNVPFDPSAQQSDYDMRGFYDALQKGDPIAQSSVNNNDGQIHYPDYWKTPYHQTFSNESQWATPDAPKWDGDRLIGSDGSVVFDENPSRASGGRIPHMAEGGGLSDADVGIGSPAPTGGLSDDAVGVTQPMSTTEASLEGFKKGMSANWSDEVYGASKASGLPEWMGGFRAPVGAARLGYESLTDQPGFASDEYAKGVAFARQRQEQAQKEHPTASILSEIAGAGTGALAMPIGGAATMLGRIAQGSKIGATYGALSGAGDGTDFGSRATGAGLGAATGAVTGAALPPVTEGLIQGATQLARPIVNTIRGAVNPEGEASRRVVTALGRDFQNAGPSLTPEEIAVANAAGTPRAIIDAGDETTRALARSSANTSPEARASLAEMTGNRFTTQNDRTASFISRLTGANGDNPATLDALQVAARKANKPAYDQAFAEGNKEIISPEIERLMGSPAMVDAMRRASTTGKDRAITEGFGAFNPGVTVDNGVVAFKPKPNGVPTYPNLQFWDATKRELDDAASVAARSGEKGKAEVLGNLSRSLREELDGMVPSYGAARSGAAQAFGAQDALEAGSKFVSSRMDNAEAARAFYNMSQPEKELFRQGYASTLINKVRETGDSRSILNTIAQSPADRERLALAFGAKGANQLETFLRVEGVLDRARTAVSGNSTTARQLAELGLAGGAYGIASGGDLTNPRAVATGALVWGLTHGNRKVNESVARQVGEMLTSDNPAVLNKGIEMASRHANIFDGLRRIDGFGTGAAGNQSVGAMKGLQGIMPVRADDKQQSP